ncbi:hypothetical protein OESDEN_01521 [Oesophagostomum dentatum]|uniref:IBR domain-containing protein n=1 Tax=Oesophagostomum dentatum TaxID=61180 RepID=A0A0B1TML7_OESDE|nr:hypothetical protein OESDEN_01521 [Oesophagostomum dentatum]
MPRFLKCQNEVEFPYLYSKPGGGEGKRTKGKRCDGATGRGAPPAFIMKVLEDPAHALGKRRQARILQGCADTYTPGLMYSMDKKNRWSQDPETLLNGIDDEEVTGQVVEERTLGPVCRWRESKVVALHELGEDGVVKSKVAKGQGASLSTMTTPPREKQRGCRARRENAMRKAAEEEERNGCAPAEDPEKAKVRYSLIHEPPVYYGRFQRRTASPKSRRVRVKRVDVSDLEQSELEQSVHLEEDGYKPSRDLKFCLGDYINDHMSGLSHVGRKRLNSSEELDIEQLNMPELKPFDLVDVASVLRTPATFEFAHIYTDNWKDFKFLEQVEALRDKYSVKWLDTNHQRVLIDVTSAFTLDREYQGAPIAMLTIEQCRSKQWHYLRILLNTTVPPPKDFDWKVFKKNLKDNNVCSVQTLVEETIRLPVGWRKHEVVDMTRFKQRNEYLPMFNVADFARPVQRLTAEHMALLLRAECEQLETDTFERVEHEHFESELEEVGKSSQHDSLPAVPAGVKCASCDAFDANDLYEMDDSWLCRNCLKQQAINQIRIKSLPIHLPVGITEFQALRAEISIIPASLLLCSFPNYFLAALELVEMSVDDMTTLDACPGCNQLVDLEKPNEYNCVACECGIVWCSECKKYPHWPMSCQRAAEWKKRWQQQDLEVDLHVQRVREITCSCLGPPILFGETDQFAECKSCGVGFNPQTMRITTSYGRPCPRIEKYSPISDRILPSEYVPRIKKEVVEICKKAHDFRFDISKWNELEKASRKLKDTFTGLEKLRDIRQMVLYLVEFGMAWVYMEKSLNDRAQLKSALCSLLRLYEDVIAAIVYQRSNFNDTVELLNTSVQKTLDLIKHSV